MEGATKEDIDLIRSAPIKTEKTRENNEENGEEVSTEENGDSRKRDKFSRHDDDSEDENTSEKNDTEKKRKSSKDSDPGETNGGEKIEKKEPEPGIKSGKRHI